MIVKLCCLFGNKHSCYQFYVWVVVDVRVMNPTPATPYQLPAYSLYVFVFVCRLLHVVVFHKNRWITCESQPDGRNSISGVLTWLFSQEERACSM
jgi:hypothetical protein